MNANMAATAAAYPIIADIEKKLRLSARLGKMWNKAGNASRGRAIFLSQRHRFSVFLKLSAPDPETKSKIVVKLEFLERHEPVACVYARRRLKDGVWELRYVRQGVGDHHDLAIQAGSIAGKLACRCGATVPLGTTEKVLPKISAMLDDFVAYADAENR